MTAQVVKVVESKVEAIRSWPVLRIIHDVRSFHGLASFYREFIRKSNTIMAFMTKVIKDTSFKWTPRAQLYLRKSNPSSLKLQF